MGLRWMKVIEFKFGHLCFSYCSKAAPLLMSNSFFFPISGDDEGLEEFLVEDREAELCQFKNSQAETRKLICDALQVDWGRGEVVSPERAKDLILQVTIPISQYLQFFKTGQVSFAKLIPFFLVFNSGPKMNPHGGQAE